jgi:hypothetical protein
MSNLRRRLNKLQASFIDASGFAPHSPAWLNYWMEECGKAFGDRSGPPKRVPLEAIRAWLEAQPNTDHIYDHLP